MNFSSEIALDLNPRYLKSGFKTQARNIAKKEPVKNRQLACLLHVVSEHILRHGSACFASTHRLLALYNQCASLYQIKTICERTLRSRLNAAELSGLISRDHTYNHQTGQTRRFIMLNLNAIKSLFSGVYNYAAGYALKRHNRHNLPIGRPVLDNSDHPLSPKPSHHNDERANCRKEGSKDLSKERKENRYNGQPSDSFYVTFFKQDANQTKELQVAARQGRLSASGAKKLIAIHAKHGFEFAKSFKRYLHSLIAGEHSTAKRISGIEQRVHGGSAKEALTAANEVHLSACRELIESGRAMVFYDNQGRVHTRAYFETLPTDEHVALGRAEYCRDVRGRIQVSWIHHSMWPELAE